MILTTGSLVLWMILGAIGGLVMGLLLSFIILSTLSLWVVITDKDK